MKSTSKKHKEPEINYDQLQGNKLVKALKFNGKIILKVGEIGEKLNEHYYRFQIMHIPLHKTS